MGRDCPVRVGDIFYRKTDSGINIPDRLKVIGILRKEESEPLIRARYMYHTVGPVFERTFSSKIFDDPNWVIEKEKTI